MASPLQSPGFNGSYIAKLIAAVVSAAIIALVTILWDINSKIAVIDDRVTRLLIHSDRNDEAIEKRMRELEQRLNDLMRR
jgi:hypothetical protein